MQRDRVVSHFAEAISDADVPHNPLHMLDRALMISAFAIRRMVEKRLITDKLADVQITVRTFPSRDNGEFHQPYVGESGGTVHNNYSIEKPELKDLKIGEFANEIIHASQLMIVQDEYGIEDGLAIASDWHLKKRLLHVTPDEFSGVVDLILNDFVRIQSEAWDPATGKVTATRL
ncbi:hypothetical protein ACVIGB_002024 [Bradyrhizobium sp. USDA 4341]